MARHDDHHDHDDPDATATSDAAPLDNAAAPPAKDRRLPARVPLASLVLAGLAVALLIVAVAVALNARADPAEVKELAEQYTESTNALGIPLTQTQAECRAEVYLESDLSDDALDDIRAGREPRPTNARDIEVLTELATDLAQCL